MPSSFYLDDGIISWYDGPEWDQVAYEAFRDMIPDVEGYAKANAPWADQTGDARSGLTADVAEDDGVIFMTLFHTVEYGYWLELIQSGNFAIILSTLEAMADPVMAHVAEKVSTARDGRGF